MDIPLSDRVRSHDTQALAEFIHERRKPLLAFIERELGASLRRKVEAEDIVQEVAAEALRSLESMEFGERDPFSWLCQIAERKIIDTHRHFFGSQKRDAAREVGLGAGGSESQQPGLIHLLVASITSASQAFSRNAKEARLAEAMQELSPEQQTALRLRYVENKPSQEIAAQLGKSDVAVRVMISRTLKKLQELLMTE